MNRDTEEKVLSFLGLCRRAGQVQCGQDVCAEAAKNGKTQIIFMDPGVSANTRERVTAVCGRYRVPLYALADPGCAVGRPACRVLCVSSGGMAEKLLRLLENEPVWRAENQTDHSPEINAGV